MSGPTGLQVQFAAMNHIYSLPSILSLDTRTDWLVDELIPRGAITLLTGESGTGKSTFALAMAAAIAAQKSFLGRKTTRSKVLYIDGENPLSVVHERFVRLGIDDNEFLKIWGGWNEISPRGPEDCDVIDWARETSGLIIFDPLIAFNGNGSEQDASDIRKSMNRYRALANAGAAVCATHHTGKGKGSNEYRGSTDIKAAVDQAYLLESLPGNKHLSDLRLKPFKERIATVEPIRFGFENGQFRTKDGSERSQLEIVRRIINETRRATQQDIIANATTKHIGRNRCVLLLKYGCAEGLWTVIKVARGGHQYLLTDSKES